MNYDDRTTFRWYHVLAIMLGLVICSSLFVWTPLVFTIFVVVLYNTLPKVSNEVWKSVVSS